MSEYREWTLLLTGEHSGLVGEASYKFSGSPDYYERVDVVEKQRIAELEAKVARLEKESERLAAEDWNDE